MIIPIHNRIVLIIGPTTSGKTTLSYKLKKTSPVTTTIISQDVIANSVIEGDACRMPISKAYCKKFSSYIKEAIKNPEEFIVLDVLNVCSLDVFKTLFNIKIHGYFGKITLLKMNLPFELHSEFCGERKDFNGPHLTTETLFSNMVRQLTWYQNSSGSLHKKFPFTEEYLIEDPREVEFTYPFISSKQYKKQK